MTRTGGSFPPPSAGRLRIIGNPASGRGRGARMISATRAAFAVHGFTDVVMTERADDEARLVHAAIGDGIDTLIVAGGDGTWSKCAVTLAQAGSPARMAFLAAGTGNDFAKNLRAPSRDAVALSRLVASGEWTERRVDMGRVDDAWFLNVAGFGFDVAVLRSKAFEGSPLRGPARYVATAVRELFRCEGVESRMRANSGVSEPGDGAAAAPWDRHLLMVFSNGAHFGGAFRIAPDAEVDDGALDAIVIGDGPPLLRLTMLARALRGVHLTADGVTHSRGARFQLDFRETPWFEVDGELRRATSTRCEVASLPGVLRVLDATKRGDTVPPAGNDPPR